MQVSCFPSGSGPAISRQATGPWGLGPDVWAAGIILLCAVVRFGFIASGQLDLVQDECQYWDWSRRALQLSYYSKGPLIAWIIRAGCGLFGDTPLGVRAGAAFFATASQVVLYLGMSRLLARPWAGVWAVVVTATMPLFLASGLLMTTDTPLAFFWLCGLLCVQAAAEGRGGRWPWLGLMAALVLGIWAKYMMLALALVALLHGLLLRGRGMAPAGFLPRLVMVLLLGVAVGMAPIAIWNAQNGGVGYLHVAHLAGVGGDVKPEPLLRWDCILPYLGSQVGLATPWWLWFMLAGGVAAVRRWTRGAADADARLGLLLGLGFWPMFLVFILWSLHTNILPNWPAVMYVSGAMLAGLALDGGMGAAKDACAAGLAKWRKVWLGCSIVVFAVVHSVTVLPVPSHYNPAMRLMGFADLGRSLQTMVSEKFAEPKRVFYFSGSYDMTAVLSFYAPGHPLAYCADFGDRRQSQYDLWPGPQGRAGQDAVYLLKDDRPLPPELGRMFARVERVVYRTTHHGRPGRTFTIGLCHTFNGYWPQHPASSY